LFMDSIQTKIRNHETNGNSVDCEFIKKRIIQSLG
jgi:hypothetical protein